MDNSKSTNIGLTYAFLAFFLYAVSDAARKFLVMDFSVFDIQFWICLITIIGVAGYALYRRRLRALLYTKHPYLHLARCACVVPVMFLVTYVLETMPLVDFYTIIFTTPMVTCLLASIFFKDKITLVTMLAIGLGFMGVIIAYRPGLDSLNIPFFMCLLTVLCIAVTANIYRLFPPMESKLSFVLFPTIISLVISLFFISDNVMSVGFLDIFNLTIAAVTVIFGVVFSVFAYAKAPVAMVSATHYSQLLWGLIFGYMIFGNLPDYYMTIGAIIVTFSGIILAFSNRRRKNVRRLVIADPV